MWDVINSPECDSYHEVCKSVTSPRRTRRVDMSAITTLTVFCTSQSTYGIYAHRANKSAVTAYQNLSTSIQQVAMWRYFRFTPGEVISGAWIHERLGVAGGTILKVVT